MKIAFYAPMKSPNNPIPSGDRLMARNLMAALVHAGHTVHLASELCTKDLSGNAAIQAKHQAESNKHAHKLIQTYSSDPIDLWVTYHSYYKAPDYLGPAVSKALSIPYVLIEPSHNPNTLTGPWANATQASRDAIQSAHLLFTLNPKDIPALKSLTTSPIVSLLPFVSLPAVNNGIHRSQSKPVLITVGMMRAGNKERSYSLLAESLRLLNPDTYDLICVGGGPQEQVIQQKLTDVTPHTRLMGELSELDVLSNMQKADLFIWPAYHESFGMAILQAQSMGLPAVVGYTPGVAQIVHHGLTGLISPPEDPETFAQNIHTLLIDPTLRHRLGENARTSAQLYHGLDHAAHQLDKHLRSLQIRRAA